jgi:alkanesulfonate monooxygenase SsuD/methylene tetrahydromethanopterin reductase-like flavin-dependent oxidoreductase (luciferase family)
MEFHLYLPQMRLAGAQLVEKAVAAEAAGFHGLAGMDHMAPPGALDQPMFEAMVTNAWLAGQTSSLTLSTLVLCDAFRSPTQLAKECVSLDHLSGGRFELGIGWGSQTWEIEAYGMGALEPRDRVQRLRETLELLRALWAGETVDHEGEHFQVHGARQAPTPLERIPIVIGGAGPKTMALVAEFADWWNVHVGIRDRFEEMRDRAGDARISLQQMFALVPEPSARAEIAAQAERRFPGHGVIVGTAPELVDHIGNMANRGVERLYTWFTDFASTDTLAAFGREVIAELG